MYNIIDVYKRPYNEKEPVVCFDEKSKQLVADTRKPIFGKVKKVDYEYSRNGTRNIFVAVEPLGGKRRVEVTKHRKKADFANFIKGLVDNEYQKADKIHLVLDNLNTHFAKSFYETFSQEEADRILEKIRFHYTPKHASWLNMAEIEIGIMDRQCLNRRLSTEEMMKSELKKWQKERNEKEAKIIWKFSKKTADQKLAKYYT